jgi:nucleoside-diphosphate-sugar epimerase
MGRFLAGYGNAGRPATAATHRVIDTCGGVEMASFLIVGCGYLGQRVARQLLALGHAVFATTRKPERAASFREQGITPVICDVLSPDSLRLPEADGVVYCVGLDRTAGASMRAVYVEGLRNVLSALPGGGRLVYVSSTSVYGQTGGEEVDEDSETAPLEESGKVVLEAERLLRERRTDAVVLRFAGIYGPGRLLREAALRRGEPLAGDASKWLNLIHVEDGAAAVVSALTRSVSGETFNVADGHPVTRGEFYGLLAKLLGAPPAAFTAPASPEPVNRRVAARRMRERLGVVPRRWDDGLRA